MLPSKVVEKCPSAAVKQGSFVVSEAMKEVQNWICLCGMLGLTRIVASGKIDAVVNRMFQNLAVHRIAIDTALSASRKRNSNRREKEKDSEPAIHRFQFTRSARLARDLTGPRVLPGKGPRRDSRGKKTIGRTPPATTARTRNVPPEKTGF